MLKVYGRRYDNQLPVCVTIDGDSIVDVSPVDGPADDWPWIAPGLFDHQINGYGGTWFSDENLTPADVVRVMQSHFQHGTTRLCPTLITNSFAALAAGLAAVRTACETTPWVDRMIPGIHLEGPYLSAEDGPRGAHPIEHIRPADFEEFQRLQEISDNRIKLVTLAPEVENGLEFIRRVSGEGITVSIGHTAASPEQITAAVDAGARMSTHLGNGAHGVLKRHPNYIWEQLGEPRLAAGIIVDGHHLPASVVRTIVRTKGCAQTFLTCDASGLAGCKPGRYRFDSVEVEVLADGPIVIAGQRQLLAGSGQHTDVCVAKAIEFASLTLEQAIDMAGKYPARWLGFEEISLNPGSRADLVVFEYGGAGQRLQIQATIAAGELRFGGLPQADAR